MNRQAEVIWAGLEFRKPMMLRNVEPLSAAQMLWQPGGERAPHNCVAWQLWHIAEVEDNWVGAFLLGRPYRFPFGVQVREAAAEQYPSQEQLLGYFHEVRETTRIRLEATGDADFERRFTDPDFGELTGRDLWAGVVTSFAWHAGQIALVAKLLPDSPVKTMRFTYWKPPS